MIMLQMTAKHTKKYLDCSVVIVNIFIRVHRVVLNRTIRRAKHGLGQQKIQVKDTCASRKIAKIDAELIAFVILLNGYAEHVFPFMLRPKLQTRQVRSLIRLWGFFHSLSFSDA